jgi:ABC-type spermidine/putrescine transport system permease subunit II
MTAERSYRSDWRDHAIDGGLVLWYLAAVVFLFAPIVAAIVYSFNLGVVNKQTAVLTGWTLQWYPAAWHDLSLRRAVTASLVVSFWSALISIVMGTLLGYAIARHPSKRMRRFLAGFTYMLLIVPESVIGVSLLLFFAVTRFPLNTATLVAGITPMAIAVVALVIRARMLTLDREVEEVAADLGSTRVVTLSLVILPQLAPAIAVGGVMAYTFSFDNLVISAFLTTARINTLPVYLYGSLQYGPSPAVYAAAAAVFLFTMLLLALAVLIYGLTRRPAAA